MGGVGATNIICCQAGLVGCRIRTDKEGGGFLGLLGMRGGYSF